MPSPPKKVAWWIVSAALIVAGGVGVAAWLRTGSAHAIPVLGSATITVLPGVHLLGGVGPSPAYAIETSDGVVLVDAGLEADAAPVKTELARLGLDWTRIRWIVLTHAHGDHTGGAEHLRRMTGAKVYAGQGDADVLRAGGPREAIFSNFYMPNHATHPTTIDVELDRDTTIPCGDLRLRAVLTPGHTPGSVCYIAERAGQRILFGGDVVMHPGNHDSLGTYSAYLAPRYRGDARGFLASIEKLRALPAPNVILPGHPRQDPPRNPTVTSAEWTAMLDDGARELETLLARSKSESPGFLDGEPKRLLNQVYYLGDIDGVAVYAFLASGELFVVNAPGGPAFAGLLKTRLQQLGLPPCPPAAILLTGCDEKLSSGVPGIVASGSTVVVGSKEAAERYRAVCPESAMVLATEELARKRSFNVDAIRLQGATGPEVAYAITVDGNTALFTGHVPANSDDESLVNLDAALSTSREARIEHIYAIHALEKQKPDLWLPAVPAQAQNAHVRENEWKALIALNYRIAERRLPAVRILPHGMR